MYARRKLVNNLAFGVTILCAVFAASILCLILGYLVWHGLGSLNLAFFTKLPAPVGEAGGGVANAIVGSCMIILIAACLGVPIGILGAVYLVEYAGSRYSFLVRYATDLLNGIPSIVIGIFVYTIIVLHTRRFSAWAGGCALAVIVLPTTLRSAEQFLLLVPSSLREAAYALGAPKWKVIITVVLPAAMRGILTGVMLSIARIAGETAPLLFTSFNNRFWARSLNEPTASLPVMIYTYAISPYEDWHRQAWAAGFTLLFGVLVINVVVRVALKPRFQPK